MRATNWRGRRVADYVAVLVARHRLAALRRNSFEKITAVDNGAIKAGSARDKLEQRSGMPVHRFHVIPLGLLWFWTKREKGVVQEAISDSLKSIRTRISSEPLNSISTRFISSQSFEGASNAIMDRACSSSYRNCSARRVGKVVFASLFAPLCPGSGWASHQHHSSG